MPINQNPKQPLDYAPRPRDWRRPPGRLRVDWVPILLTLGAVLALGVMDTIDRGDWEPGRCETLKEVKK